MSCHITLCLKQYEKFPQALDRHLLHRRSGRRRQGKGHEDGDGIVEPHEWTKMCPCFDAKEEYKDLLP